MAKDIPDWTDDELIAAAQAGLKRQGAVVESMRRLRNGINEFKDSSEKYSRRMEWLTGAVLLLALVQLIGRL
jgi:hypothetical protein